MNKKDECPICGSLLSKIDDSMVEGGTVFKCATRQSHYERELFSEQGEEGYKEFIALKDYFIFNEYSIFYQNDGPPIISSGAAIHKRVGDLGTRYLISTEIIEPQSEEKLLKKIETILNFA